MHDDSAFAHSDGHLHLPDFSRVLHPDFLYPFVAYFAFFRICSHLVKTYAWQQFSGFKQYRLHNLSICLLHSAMSGGWALHFALSHPDIMLEQTMHWYDKLYAHLPIFSIAYFVHDSIDMLAYEVSRWTFELLFHHVVCCLAFGGCLFSGKFLAYNYWALLMEVSSVTLHIRTISQLSGFSIQYPTVTCIVKYVNVFTCVVFRFCVQFWQIQWAFRNMQHMHAVYALISFGGGCIFLVINGQLISRILASDGFLGEKRKRAEPNRDQERIAAEANGKKSQ